MSVYFFLIIYFVVYACFMLIWSWESRKTLGQGFLLSKIVSLGLQETNNFFRPNGCC